MKALLLSLFLMSCITLTPSSAMDEMSKEDQLPPLKRGTDNQGPSRAAKRQNKEENMNGLIGKGILPLEILHHIFSFLDLKSFVRLSELSKGMKKMKVSMEDSPSISLSIIQRSNISKLSLTLIELKERAKEKILYRIVFPDMTPKEMDIQILNGDNTYKSLREIIKSQSNLKTIKTIDNQGESGTSLFKGDHEDIFSIKIPDNIKPSYLCADKSYVLEIPKDIKNINLETLSLEDNLIRSVPQLPSSLVTLNLSKNSLWGTIDLSGLKSLESLDLSNCKLSCFPEGLKDSKNIRNINLSRNHIPSIPSNVIEFLVHLDTINLSHNNLYEIPSELTQIAALKILNISHNKIEILPEEWQPLPRSSTAKRLEKVDASHNLIKKFPLPTIELGNLKCLDLGHNELGELPSELFGKECQFSRGTTLKLNHNKLTSLPRWLLVLPLNLLDLFENNLITVPVSSAQYVNLKENSISIPPNIPIGEPQGNLVKGNDGPGPIPENLLKLMYAKIFKQ